MKLGREVSRHNELENWRNTHRFESVMATKWLLLTISETEPGLWDRLNRHFVRTGPFDVVRVYPIIGLTPKLIPRWDVHFEGLEGYRRDSTEPHITHSPQLGDHRYCGLAICTFHLGFSLGNSPVSIFVITPRPLDRAQAPSPGRVFFCLCAPSFRLMVKTSTAWRCGPTARGLLTPGPATSGNCHPTGSAYPLGASAAGAPGAWAGAFAADC